MPKLSVTKINFVKKLSLILLSSVLFLNSMFMPFAVAKAAEDDPPSTWYNQTFEGWFVKVYGDESPPSEIFGERYTAAQVQWILYSLVALPFVSGSEISKQAITCALTKEVTECADVVGKFIEETLSQTQKSDPVKFGQVIMQNPASGIGYINSLIHKFSIVPEAQAQGFGYNASDLAKNLWGITRNISYSLIVLTVIILAFMIMFRVKISPQIVISVQSALPKIISGTILITFSYAIAGFAIDLMYVVLGLLSSLLIQSGLTDHDFITLFNSFVEKNVFWTLMQYWVMFLISSLVALKAWMALGVGIIVLIFWIVMVFVLIFMSIKIIFMMIKNFIGIFFDIILGPLQILFGIVLNNTGFSQWLRGLFAKLAVYPTVAMMFFFAFFFLRQALPVDWGIVNDVFPFDVTYQSGGANNWKPPFTFGVSNNAVTGGIDILFVVMSFVIITMIPKTVEIITGVLSGKPFAYGSAIGEAMGPINMARGPAETALKIGIAERWAKDQRDNYTKMPLAAVAYDAWKRANKNAQGNEPVNLN